MNTRASEQEKDRLDWFIYAFVRKEALLSSEIEGTQATLVDVLAWEQAEQPGASNLDDIEEVTNYVAAVNLAFIRPKAHRSLCAGSTSATAS